MGRRTQWGVTRTCTQRHTDSIIYTDTVIWVAAGQKSKPKIQKKAKKKERRNQINIQLVKAKQKSLSTLPPLAMSLLSGKTLEPKSNWDLWAQRCVSRSARRALFPLLLLQLFASNFHVVFHDYRVPDCLFRTCTAQWGNCIANFWNATTIKWSEQLIGILPRWQRCIRFECWSMAQKNDCKWKLA